VARSFHIITQEPSPRFLGLALAERNRQVARRAIGPAAVAAEGDTLRPTLTIPAAVAITPALFPAMPAPGAAGVWDLVWHPARPPLVWHGPVASATSPRQTMTVPDGAVLDVSTPSARRRSIWRLLRASGKPTDGWLSRHVHRKISRPFSFVFLELGVSANVATLATFGVGAAAAWLLAQTSHATMIAGGFLIWFTSIADGIDGEVARLTLSESAFGEQLDTAVDLATYLLALTGVFIGWQRQGIGWPGAALIMLVAAGLPIVVLWAMAMVRRARGTRQLFVPTKPIELALKAAVAAGGPPPLRAASALFVLFRREAFSLAFFLVSLTTGRRVVFPVLIACGLIIVTATLYAYRPRIEQELRALA
jgi:phosphatidylglycerophosphate synthase